MMIYKKLQEAKWLSYINKDMIVVITMEMEKSNNPIIPKNKNILSNLMIIAWRKKL